MMMSSQIIITPDGLAKAKDELIKLQERQKEVLGRIEEALKLGDLSENADYTEAKEEQHFLDRQINEIQGMINNAIVTDKIGKNSSIIGLGSKINVEFNGNTKEFTIVSINEADPLAGLISNESPLGRAFIGKSVGDEIEVVIPRGMVKYKILEIN